MSSNSPWTHSRAAGVADDIDFEIKGQELQFVEIELDPGESAVAEAGALVWKDAAIGMTTVFGDGSDGGGDGGFMGKLLGAGKRLVTGESLFTTVFTHNGTGKARVAFASPTPGAILPLRLGELGGTLICQKDSFLAAAKGVSIGIQFQRKVMTGLFGRWEGNWVGWNTAHDITLPSSAGKGTLPFLMYPNGENAKGRFDELSPDTFRYAISARQITG